MSVAGDRIGSGGEEIDALVLHGVCDHVVGDDGGVKAHLCKAARSKARALKIRAGLRAEHAEILTLLHRGADDGADDGLAEALRQNGAVVRDKLFEIISDDLHGAVPAVERFNGRVNNGFYRIPTGLKRSLRNVGAVIGYLTVAIRGSGARMSEVIGGLLKEAVLLGGRLITNLIRGESHAHTDSGVGSRALRHHVGDSLDYLLIAGALDKTNLGEYPAVKYTNLAVFIPCHILVFEKEGHAGVHSFHTLLLLMQ